MSEHIHLTDLEQLLLLAVLRLGDDAYGARIQTLVEEDAARRVSLGSIYMTLGRLEERSLAASAMGEPRSRRGGRSRRIYAVTTEGRAALEWCRGVYERMWAGVTAEGRP